MIFNIKAGLMLEQRFLSDPVDWLLRNNPDEPVFFFDPRVLRRTAEQFRRDFPGLVTYAVKANPEPEVLATLVQAGMQTFDIASPAEMALVRAVCPGAVLHYHNPIRSLAEIEQGRSFEVASWSIDRKSELDKLGNITGCEIAVRLKLPLKGAAYDFGEKFGAEPDRVTGLLQDVVARGGLPSVTFHPGTQCEAPKVWAAYIAEAAQAAARAGVTLHRLNVGGGFAAHRKGAAPDIPAVFRTIQQATAHHFDVPPPLVCEPGRAMVAEAFKLAVRIKAKVPGAVYLNDGIYGGLSEWRDLLPGSRLRVISADGVERTGRSEPTTIFGPTCDSLDKLPSPVALPGDCADGDHVLLEGMGAYAAAITTGFNGYGARRVVTLTHPTGDGG
ncbi:type III PLP-dependent enzyme domain-containing protein [Thalassococcus lentus]